MARDRFLKVNGWVVHMDQDRGVYQGKQHLELHQEKHWDQKQDPEEVPMLFYEEGMAMKNMKKLVWGRQCEWVPLVFFCLEWGGISTDTVTWCTWWSRVRLLQQDVRWDKIWKA